MNPAQFAIEIGERVAWPDFVTRALIDKLVGRTNRRLDQAGEEAELQFAQEMNAYPIAVHTAKANTQHYEVPSEFFAAVLGPQRKYSCCLFDDGATSLAAAEEAALAATAEHARLADGQTILELGCGWGSLSLWMARRFPGAQILSVSNSHSQRAFIEAAAAAERLGNLKILTADMNDFVPQGRFDRVVSIEMFEHMSNWRPLLARTRSCLSPQGRLFLHVFSHRLAPYRFDHTDKSDWIAQHFFTGGIMPSHRLIRQFDDLFDVEADWNWGGHNYALTAGAWLANFDAETEMINGILRQVYGRDWRLWRRRWRLFFLATMGLFGHGKGADWGVSHYSLAPVS